MANIATERVTEVRHWNDSLFSFKTTRDPAFRFESGQFVMLGLPVEGRPLLRAYSIASASYEDHLEFFSIKVQDGPLTSRLQHLAVNDEVFVSRKPTGTLVLRDITHGKHLYLLGTGTGLAPFLSLIQEPETYERFEKIVIVHGTRSVSDLAYAEYITRDLPHHEFLGEQVRNQLIYYPTVTREPFRNSGRITKLLETGDMATVVGLPPLDPAHDRFMLCGSPAMLKDCSTLLDARGFAVASRIGEPGDYVIERAFVEK
jgi:ferredoxin/flavodoxin---NADP+ reductase